MKKIVIMLLLLCTLSSCTKVKGAYKEGTYYAYDEESNYSVIMYVDETGLIKSMLFDAVMLQCSDEEEKERTCTPTDTFADIKVTTKQHLGEAYGMRSTSDNMGIIEGGAEWYEQVASFANKVMAEQNLDWLVFKYKNEEGKATDIKPSNKTEKDKVYTDSVAGVTIKVDNLYKLANMVLSQAK